MSFLKAEWRKLVMVNYEVDPEVLKNYIPKGTELDFYENKCYISVVGFMFLNTKLLGVKVPFHVNFEEVNLRFYVKREGKRGVVFIKEIVPKPAITLVANKIYKENYQTLPMKHSWTEKEDMFKVSYQWKINQKRNSVSVESKSKSVSIKPYTEIEFITEHYWGYAKDKRKTTEYEVKHPTWEYYPVTDYNIDVDFSATYGEHFSFLQSQKPSSVFLLEGSEISVENKTVL
ncbi:YqjF family protein [Tenacibaculum sp. SDUM215027]|uniref:YqjF family protein n=1 Tax=Tenacibaculum sp. SDUM215027 TaxID=3422596 RepID=UPI003D320F86